MKNDNFGSIIYKEKMVDLNNSSISDLEKIADDLEKRNKKLTKKVITVFNQ